MDVLAVVLLVVWGVLIMAGLPGLVAIHNLRAPRGVASGRAVRSRTERDRAGGERTVSLPKVSIIVAARNEERGIGDGLRSLMRLEYPGLEIIAVNDRSTDRTGEIMREVAGENPSQVRVIDITDLPKGWLGKNHALYQGSMHASGEWLLFTDADVVFHPQALTIAVEHAVSHGYDHLALAPLLKSESPVLRALVLLFAFNLMLFFLPQYARFKWSPTYIGIGAFNLIRTEVYQAIGTHEAIRMRPDDDLKLGRQVKAHGYRQDFALGDELLSVEWYTSVGEMIRGLEKNTLAPFEYRIWLFLIGGLPPLSVFYLMPFVGPFVADGMGQTLFLINFVLCLLYFMLHDRFSLASLGSFLLWPVTVPIFVYAMGRAAVLTWIRGGIAWRDTRYSLAELKQK